MKVLITGSTQGIGMSLARAFVRQGDEVTVHCSRDREKAERIRREIGAAIRIFDDGKFLYVSLREENSIRSFDLSGKTPLEIQCVSCGGNGPRDFNIFGDFVVCCNEKSNNVTVFRITDGIIGEKTDEIYIDAPLCVL